MSKLTNYAKSGKYVFHGSAGGNIKSLEPKQALSFGKPDHTPAVHATAELDLAVFMAVVSSRYSSGWGRKDETKYGLYIVTDNPRLGNKDAWSGYVYVLPKVTFEQRLPWEWCSYTKVVPKDIVKVTLEDLSSEFYIMSLNEYNKYSLEQSERTE